MRTRNLTIVLSDVKGYTERQSRSSRREIEEELFRHRSLLAPIFSAFGGRVVKTMGDAFLVAFESPTDAVHSAVQVQKALAAENARVADASRATQVRIAVSTGEVSEDSSGDVFGEPVNVAARLQSIGEPGTVYLTETTFLSMNRNEIPTLEVGHRVFKGIPDEVKVYRIVDEYVANARLMSPDEIRRVAHAVASSVTSSAAPGAPSSGTQPRARGGHPLLFLAVGVVLAVGVGAAVWFGTRPPDADKPDATAALTEEQALKDLRAAMPKLGPAAARWVRTSVDRLVKAEQWDKARDLAKRAYDAVPTSEPARDLWLDVSRWELEAAARSTRIEEMGRENPPRWYEQNVQGLYDRYKDVPRYEWLRAVWFVATDATRATTPDVVEKALKDNPDARADASMRSLLVGALAATTGNNLLHTRYQALIDRWSATEKTPGGTTPAGRRVTGGMRDR